MSSHDKRPASHTDCQTIDGPRIDYLGRRVATYELIVTREGEPTKRIVRDFVDDRLKFEHVDPHWQEQPR